MYFLSVNKIKTGANPEDIKRTIPLHIQWVKEMISRGCIVQAGKWGETGGIAIIQANSASEAGEIINTDPLIKSGIVTFEI
jgi:uncharacterized protein YciI